MESDVPMVKEVHLRRGFIERWVLFFASAFFDRFSLFLTLTLRSFMVFSLIVGASAIISSRSVIPSPIEMKYSIREKTDCLMCKTSSELYLSDHRLSWWYKNDRRRDAKAAERIE